MISYKCDICSGDGFPAFPELESEIQVRRDDQCAGSSVVIAKFQISEIRINGSLMSHICKKCVRKIAKNVTLLS